MQTKEEIIKAIVKTTGLRAEDIHLETPEREEFGDCSSNVAMQLFSKSEARSTKHKKLNVQNINSSNVSDFKSPRELAEAIVERLRQDEKLQEIIERIEVAGPGFINFYLTRSILVKELEKIISTGDEYGKTDLLKDKGIMVEYGQPNTHKLPHIGHLFSYIYGSSLSMLLEEVGAKIVRANYQGDVGPHVAKCLWALKRYKGKISGDLEKKVGLLQKMYQEGSFAYENNDNAKEQITEINKKIYSGKDSEIQKLWLITRKWSLNYYSDFEKRLDIKYDRSYLESEVYKGGKNIVEENLGEVFSESKGAVIFEGSKHGLHDRVFITSNGTPTYEAKDMYLQTLKFSEWKLDRSIVTTASEQNEYFKVIYKALEELNDKFKGRLVHIGFGMVQIKGGKLSSRKGEIISAIDLVEKIIYEIRQIIKDRKDLSTKEKEEITEIVGIGAVKYSFLKSNPMHNIIFDLGESISTDGNSGPYIQYTYARTQSVLRKARSTKHKIRSKFQTLNSNGKKVSDLNEEEFILLRNFIKFPDVVANAAENYAPNLICNYLYDLAQKFNTFYQKHPILEERTKDEKQSEFRLALTSATGQILKNGLNLLGIQAPERM